MSDADNFYSIERKPSKAIIGLNSSDESIFTLNVYEDKRCSDQSSSDYRIRKKKRKNGIDVEPCHKDNDRSKDPCKKKKKNKCPDVEEVLMEDLHFENLHDGSKKKKNKCRDVEEVLMKDLHVENLECYSDSPKKSKKKIQNEDDTEEAYKSHVDRENAETVRSKKKKTKQEISEYSQDNDNFINNNLAVGEVAGKKKKKKHHDQNGMTEDVHGEYFCDESPKTATQQRHQENCSEEITKKKKKKSNTSLGNIKDNAELDNDTIHDPKKKRKSCDSSETTKKRKRTSSLEAFGIVAGDDISILEESCEENRDLFNKKSRKGHVQTQENQAKECGRETHKQKKKHKKKYDEYGIKYECLHSEYDEPVVDTLQVKDESYLDFEYKEPIVKAVLSSEDEEEQTPPVSSVTQKNVELGPKVQKKKKIETCDVNVKDLLEKSIDEEFLTEDQVVKLDNLHVRMQFEVPPLHYIETQIIKALKPSEKTMIDNLNLTVKTGAYIKEEDKQIENNWERFCQLHNFNKEESYLFTRFKHRNAASLSHEQRFNFLRFLAHGLPDRLLCSVYRRFQRNFRMKKLNLGRFTEAEDKIILEYIKTHTGQVFLELGHILNRSRFAINRRYRALTSEDVSVKWSDELSIKLVNCLQKYCGVSKKELEHWDISLDEWKRVAEKMQLPVAKLKRIWLYVVYVKLFIKEDIINSKEIRRELIKAVFESGADDSKAVNWAELATKYRGFTPEKICKIYRDTFEYHVPKGLQDDFRKGAVYLKKNVLQDSYGRLKGRTYRKLSIK